MYNNMVQWNMMTFSNADACILTLSWQLHVLKESNLSPMIMINIKKYVYSYKSFMLNNLFYPIIATFLFQDDPVHPVPARDSPG